MNLCKRLLEPPHYPFIAVFRQVPPKDFAAVFHNEAPQTAAYILSFCRNRRYIKKAVKCFAEEYQTVIAEYLKNVAEEKVDAAFVAMIEKHIESMLENNNFGSSEIRKNVTL